MGGDNNQVSLLKTSTMFIKSFGLIAVLSLMLTFVLALSAPPQDSNSDNPLEVAGEGNYF